jgi:dihydropteroate synthase
MQTLTCGRFRLTLDRPRVMAIVNATADSFSGDGVGADLDAALRRAEAALAGGADILDVGGESTRPGAEPVPEQQELDRVVPLVERLADWPVPVSVDTLKPAVMRAAIAAGASLINDVCAFRAPGAIEAVRESDVALCVMHMRGEPRSMQADPRYDDVVAEVAAFLRERVAELRAQGVAQDRLIIDPGFGFGKTLEHNLALLAALDRFVAQGLPVLVGMSRKSMVGTLSGRPVAERMPASIAAALLAVQRGARIVRVHDVAATRDALAMWQALEDFASRR